MNYVRYAQRGFTIIELLVVMGIMAILLSLASFNLLGSKQTASLDESVLTLVSEIRQQQAKAMTGDTEGRGANDTYGVYFGTDSFVLFHGSSYTAGHADNFELRLGDSIEFGTVSLPSRVVIFSRGEGEVVGYTAGSDSVVVRNNQTGEDQTITINRYGVVASVE